MKFVVKGKEPIPVVKFQGRPSRKVRRTMKYEEKLAERGLKLVRFTVPLPLWDAFIEKKCWPVGCGQSKRPNDLFIDWLREQVGGE